MRLLLGLVRDFSNLRGRGDRVNIFNKAGERFSDFFGVSDDDERYEESEPFIDEQIEDIIVEQSTPTQAETTQQKSEIQESNIKINEQNSVASGKEYDRPNERNQSADMPENQYTNKKIVEMNTYHQSTSNGNKRMIVSRQHRKVSVYEPRDYIDCKQIAQALFRKEIVILSFRLMKEQPARRIVDFMTGVVYAVDGDIQRLGDDIFICTPPNVDVDSSITRNIITNHLTEY